MYILGLDFETTGLNPESDRVIEIGAILYDVQNNYPVIVMDELIDVGFDITLEVTELTRIRNDYLIKFGKDAKDCFRELSELIKQADAIVAHNGNSFDKPFYENECRRFQVGYEPFKPWIDTTIDVPYPDKMTSRNLTYLCAMHGFLNYGAHRAYSDVEAMLKVLSHYDIQAVIERARIPMVTIQAYVDFNNKEKAKAFLYRWNPDKRIWTKQIKADKFEFEKTEAERAGFKVALVQENPVVQIPDDSPF